MLGIAGTTLGVARMMLAVAGKALGVAGRTPVLAQEIAAEPQRIGEARS
jgi:hypothetical protein